MVGFATVLAIDTSLNGCGAGLYERAGDKKTMLSRAMETGQSEALIPLVQEVAGDFKKLDTIVVTTGPGAFTGMRIGLSAAKNFGLALDIPVFGITTLQALALSYRDSTKDSFAVIIDTKRDDFYFQGFDAEANFVSEAAPLSRDEVAAILAGGHYTSTIGNGSHGFQKSDPAFDLPDCGLLAQALAGGKSGLFKEDLAPVYLRGADTSQSKKKQRILGS
ncbi:MAG: tRNA (adenosine(37)-N6)-threonylcarbamoyltransferase complex dimerization subunit type 1 TsaB [Alphaproteobacteria bacterium]